MKIGIDARYLGLTNSALARYSESLLTSLARTDEENDYVVYVHAHLKRKLKLGENFRVVPLRGHPASLNGMRRLLLAVRREEFDLLHVHYPLAPPLLNCALLLTVHDIFPFAGPAGLPLWQRLLRWVWTYVFYPLSLHRARWILCVSEATRDSLCRIFPELFHKTIVLHSGVSEAFRNPIEQPTRELILSRLELPTPFLFYSGSARADKNLIPMLRAFTLLRQRDPQWQDLSFLMDIPAGDVSLAPVQKAIEQFDLTERVRIYRDLGEEERRVLFEAASAFLIFSRSEGFGLPVLEAQLCNVPVIAVDAGALPEIAGEDGAVFINPDDLESTVSMIERVLSDETLRAYLIAQARENAQKYDWAVTADRMKQIFELLFFPRNQVEIPSSRSLLTRVLAWWNF